MVARNNFGRNLNRGRIGEKLVLGNPNSFLSHRVCRIIDNTGSDAAHKNTEGADLFGLTYKLTPSECDFFEGFEWFLRENPDVSGEQYDFKYLSGGIEIKTRDINTSLRRTDLQDWECGSVDFPLWDETSKNGVGYLQRLCQPERFENSVRPLVYVIVYVHNQDRDDVPYEVIAFEDFNKLRQRLIEIYQGKLDLKSWNGMPTGEAGTSWTPPQDVIVQGNMLQVPFELVADLATVTLVGDPPMMISRGSTCSVELQQKRWQYQVERANGRHFDLGTESEDLETTDNSILDRIGILSFNDGKNRQEEKGE